MNDYVHIEAADLRRPNARFTTERQGYQVLTPFGKLGYSQALDYTNTLRAVGVCLVGWVLSLVITIVFVLLFSSVGI